MEPRQSALQQVREHGWHVFRLKISHDEDACNGGEANCKDVSTIGGERWSQASSADEDVVAGWDWSGANAYGIDCGKSGILVVDQDPGATWPFNGTRTHTTGRGVHHVYEDLIGLGNRAHVDPWGVDVRGVGGMVIGPGSWHPHATYGVGEDIDPICPPPELMRACERHRSSGSEIPLPAFEARTRLAGVYDRMRQAPEGERNDTLNLLAGTAAGLWVRVDEDDQIADLTEDAVRSVLGSAAEEAGLGPSETAATLESGWSYGLENPVADREVESLEHEIFDATPVLSHIRQAAHSRMLGSGALLCYVLGRVLAEAPPGVLLPPAAGGDVASLNLAFALVGRSGDGKSGIAKVSARLLDLEQAPLETGLGSGEGLIESFLETVQVPSQTDPAKTVKVKRLVDPPSRILEIDEIGRLGAVGRREGSSLLSVLRSALTGGALKSSNATAERTRNINGDAYRLVVFAGVQPELSGILLDDVNAGTPQRFVWVSVLDKTQPDEEPEWPGPLSWTAAHLEFAGDRLIEYPDEVRQYLRETRLKQRHGDISPAHGHRALARLKIAAALAFLHGELDITDQWWRIAGRIIRWSVKEQERCRDAIAAEAAARDSARGRAVARQRIAESEVMDEVEDRARARVISVIEAAGEDGATGRNVKNGLSQPQRRYVAGILSELEADGQIVVESGAQGGKIFKVCGV